MAPTGRPGDRALLPLTFLPQKLQAPPPTPHSGPQLKNPSGPEAEHPLFGVNATPSQQERSPQCLVTSGTCMLWKGGGCFPASDSRRWPRGSHRAV